jgi:hypothetical protein
MVATWYVKSANDVGIAVQPVFSNEDDANGNARLIAAAPELYEALEEAVACIIANRATPGVFYEDSFEGSTLAKCEAVLAKSRGEA